VLLDALSLIGLRVGYDWHVPVVPTEYPHEVCCLFVVFFVNNVFIADCTDQQATVRLLGEHVRLIEHGGLSIKPLKAMIKEFFLRCVQGMERTVMMRLLFFSLSRAFIETYVIRLDCHQSQRFRYGCTPTLP
jgi:hypothetical protein